MNFIRQQEERLAIQFLKWRYQNLGIPLPSPTELKHRAAQIVEDAHRIARERGKNVVSIIKELINNLKDPKTNT